MTTETNPPNLDVDLDVTSPEFKIAHDRLVEVFAHRSARGTENPDEPDTVQAMQIALNLPKQHPPSRHDLLAAAAQAVVAVCLNPQAGTDGEWSAALNRWYDHRIRKVTRRARNTGWQAVQNLPGVTSSVHGAQARAFIPSAVHEVEPLIRKLQIKGTDLPLADHQPSPRADTPTIYVDAGLGMSLGKAAAQVGHGSMLLAAHQPFDWVQSWARRGFELCVVETDPDVFAQLVDAPGAVTIRDIGYTEVAPNTATVVASPRPLAH